MKEKEGKMDRKKTPPTKHPPKFPIRKEKTYSLGKKGEVIPEKSHGGGGGESNLLSAGLMLSRGKPRKKTSKGEMATTYCRGKQGQPKRGPVWIKL